MVDAERLRRILQRVSGDVATLREYAAVESAALLNSPAQLGHVKYLFITAIEGCIDAAQHVCSSEGWDPPDTNAEAVRILGRRSVNDADLSDAIAAAVGFRNLLVHGYATVDDSRVVEALKRIGDVEAFVAGVSRLAR